MSDPLSARRAALSLIDAVSEDGKLLSELLPGALDALPAPERARAQRLALATFRGQDRADRVLGKHLRIMPWPPVMALLRLATVEICALGEAPHGVVSSAVDLAREGRGPRQAGLVNAVLRKVAKDGPAAWEALPPSRLPKWLRKPLLKAYGKANVTAIEAAHATGAPLDLTAKGDAAALAETLGGTLLPTGSVRLTDTPQVSALPGYAEGDWWVQDAAAALPAQMLGELRGAKVLDLCAAPGGKTLQLAAKGAQVTAVDIAEGRMARLRENLTRCGLSAEVVTADALAFNETGFDAVLLDAPCTATGTIRRHPDLPIAKASMDPAPLLRLQAKLIDHALARLKPGGRLTFCTCSLLPEEGEEQLAATLTRHPALTVVPPEAPGLDPDWITAEGALRLRPDYWAERGGMDGFFAVTLQTPAQTPA